MQSCLGNGRTDVWSMASDAGLLLPRAATLLGLITRFRLKPFSTSPSARMTPSAPGTPELGAASAGRSHVAAAASGACIFASGLTSSPCCTPELLLKLGTGGRSGAEQALGLSTSGSNRMACAGEMCSSSSISIRSSTIASGDAPSSPLPASVPVCVTSGTAMCCTPPSAPCAWVSGE